MTAVLPLSALEELEHNFSNEPRDGYYRIQFEMVRIHITIFEGFNSIHRHLSIAVNAGKDSTPPQDDLKSWLAYVEVWIQWTVGHHDREGMFTSLIRILLISAERLVFPFMTQHGVSFDEEVEQHKNIHSMLDKLSTTVLHYKSTPSEYSNKILLQICNDAKDDLGTHLTQEIRDINRQRLSCISNQAINSMWDQVDLDARKEAGALIFGFIQTHQPPHQRDWPPIPWLIRKTVVPIMCMTNYNLWTKFAPYGML